MSCAKRDVTVMEFNGRVTLGEGSVVLRNAVREVIWAGQRKLALDYGHINYQDSSGNGEMEFNGRVTLGEGSVVLRNAVREVIWAVQRKLALDYGHINYQDSSGNGEMVSAYTTVANSGGQLVIFDIQNGYLICSRSRSSIKSSLFSIRLALHWPTSIRRAIRRSS